MNPSQRALAAARALPYYSGRHGSNQYVTRGEPANGLSTKGKSSIIAAE